MTTPVSAGPKTRHALPFETQGRAVLTRVVRRFTYPAEAPFVSITLYYIALIVLAALSIMFVPGAEQAFGAGRLAEMMTTAETAIFPPESGTAGVAFSTEFALRLAVAMVGACLLMIPPSWVYMATRRRKGFDQTVVQTILILSLCVAGVIVIVRNSVALAFSLAGIVGAVRYRNNLPETRDTLYIFLAIGVGLAAGVEALPAAAALSIVFSYTVLIIARMDYGMCELGRPAGHLLLGAPCHEPGEALPAGRHEGKHEGKQNGRRNGKKPPRDFNAVLVVRAGAAEPARAAVEPFLERETRRWQLVEVESGGPGRVAHLKYLLRLGKKQERSDLEDALLELAAPHVVGARIH